MTIRVDVFRTWQPDERWHELELALRYWFLAPPHAVIPHPPAMFAEWGPGGAYYRQPVSPPVNGTITKN